MVDQKYWDVSYKGFKFFVAQDRCSDKFKKIYNKYLNSKKISNCFELWCFPWRYLAYICKLWNYEANGVDITPELNDRFLEWLRSNKIKVGEIANEDAFTYIDELYNNGQFFEG